jgi:hypothetical protein
MLVLDEYLDSRKTEISSWLPGIYSLKNLKTSGSSSTYADLSYRQEIQWEPEDIKTVNGELFFQLAFRKIRTYKEPSLLTGFNINGKKKKFSIDNETQYSYFLHDDSLESDYYIKDFHTTLKEKIELFTNVELYLEECLGWARQYTQEEKNRPVSFDSSIYVQISPGIEWRPFNRGLAEASYTLSYVTLPGEIDYRIARGFSSGLSHLFLISASIQVGKHFSVFGNYRGEIFKPQGQTAKIPPEHTVSVEMRAFL